MAFFLVGAIGRSYLAGATASWMKIGAIGSKAGVNIGNFNALRDLGGSDSKAVVELSDLKALERALKDVGPNALRRFKYQARKVGEPAKKAIRGTFANVGIHGPLGAPKRPRRAYDKMATNYSTARLNWAYSRVLATGSRGIDVNYKSRSENKELRNLIAARDGTISIVRVIVRSPAYILADMAGKSGKGKLSVGGVTREYQQNLFGRGVVTRRHTMTAARRRAIDDWIEALDRRAHNRRQNKPSRYAWPTMEKHMGTHKELVSRLFNDTVAEINRRMSQ